MLKRGGRCAKYSTGDDLITVQEAVATKYHLYPYGEVSRRLKIGSESASAKQNITCNVTCNPLQERYKKVMDAFRKVDEKDRRISAVGEEVGE